MSNMEHQDISTIFQEAKISRVDHLPIVTAFCKKLNLIETVNQLVPKQSGIEPGVVVQAMILDTLSGRNPLYRLEEFFEQQDTELLLGKKMPASQFNDSTVARVMDACFEVGTMSIFSAIALRAMDIFALDPKYAHFDTTSKNVHGEYLGDQEGIQITFGHSKDKRPDLKQLIMHCLCVEGNIPILGDCEDGNASDKTTNNKILTQVSKYMAQFGVQANAYIYIADSAMVTEKNLAKLGDDFFISRLPFTYKEADRVVQEAVAQEQWEEVGVLAQTQPTKNRPQAFYLVAEKEVTLHGKTYRAIVVHSSSHDKRRQKRMDRELKKEKKALQAEIKSASKKTYSCQEDAQQAAQHLEGTKSRYYSIQTTIVEEVRYFPGRPSHNTPRKVKERRYRVQAEIQKNHTAIQKRREEAGCFVLISNVPHQGDMGHYATEILKAYKEQHGVERNFGFLKDPMIVNALFLKKPRRIEALGLILLLALLIWNLIERTLRKYVQQTGETLPGWDKKQTKKPTSFMMSTKFMGLQIACIRGHRYLADKLTKIQEKYLEALGLSPLIFTQPRPG